MDASTPLQIETKDPISRFFENRSGWMLLALIVLFILAGLFRLKDKAAPGILVEREFTSAIIARDFYFERNPAIAPWRQAIADITSDRQPVLEPPLTEFLVSLAYRISGRENYLYSRYLTGGFWLIGGIFMFLVARRLLPAAGAVFATGFYLLAPAGILVSRSFQPDALMMMMFLASLYLVLRYFDAPGLTSAALAGLVAGVTLLLRPLVLFAILGAFTALALQRRWSWRALVEKPALIFYAISIAIPAAYYGYGILVADFMRWKVASSFRPDLFLRFEFWREWLLVGVNEMGLAAVLAAVLGFFLVRDTRARALLFGLALGYFVFGLAFTFHIHTHGYYHVQLIPAIGIGAAGLMTATVRIIHQSAPRMWWLPVGASLALMMVFAWQGVREHLYQEVFESPQVAEEIGEIVHHSPNTVFVAYHYGLALEYYGEFSGAFWPKSITSSFYRQSKEQEKSIQERITSLGFSPEYFVITNFPEYQRLHQDLNEFLVGACDERIEGDKYMIYTACDLEW